MAPSNCFDSRPAWDDISGSTGFR